MYPIRPLAKTEYIVRSSFYDARTEDVRNATKTERFSDPRIAKKHGEQLLKLRFNQSDDVYAQVSVMRKEGAKLVYLGKLGEFPC